MVDWSSKSSSLLALKKLTDVYCLGGRRQCTGNLKESFFKWSEPFAEAKAGALLVTSLDEIAWLLNLRGSDISYNPVFVSYVILTLDKATLYVEESKVGFHLHLEEDIVAASPDVFGNFGVDSVTLKSVQNTVRTSGNT